MQKLVGTIEIKAPVQRVYDFINQPKNLPSVWTAMVEVSNVKPGAGGSFDFDWIYKMAGFHLKGHTTVLEAQPGKRLRTRSEGAIASTFDGKFEGLDGGVTRLTCEVEYEIPTPLVGKLAEAIVARLNKREQDATLANLKDMMEQEKAAAVGAAAH